MVRITLLTIGKKMPAWINDGYREYAKRLSGNCRLELVELAQSKMGDAVLQKRKEGQALLDHLPAGNHVVALDNRGSSWDTPATAQQLQRWKALGCDITLMIGGPEGLSDECLDRANQSWSLSQLTFPHPLVRVIVAEQLYRAESILRNHPYHRA